MTDARAAANMAAANTPPRPDLRRTISEKTAAAAAAAPIMSLTRSGTRAQSAAEAIKAAHMSASGRTRKKSLVIVIGTYDGAGRQLPRPITEPTPRMMYVGR